MKKISILLISVILLIGLVGCATQGGNTQSNPAPEQAASNPVTLKLTHQWPQATSTEGDFRAQLSNKFKEEVEKRTNGEVTVEIYPANSLVKATEQYDSMVKGATDLSVFPLDYASGKVPQFGVTLMPALVKNHDQAIAWETAEIGQEISRIADESGVKILTWIWNAGAIGVKGDPVVSPDDVHAGMTMRAAGKYVEEMLAAAGGSIASMSSSEIYSAMQTNILDAAITSNSSFGSFKLYEQVDSYTTSLQNTFWFMFQPLIISNVAFDKLSPEQQEIVVQVGKDLQAYAYEASKADDEAVAALFKEKGVNVVDMNDEAFAQWVELAKPIWENYGKSVDGGKELLELAQKVQAQ